MFPGFIQPQVLFAYHKDKSERSDHCGSTFWQKFDRDDIHQLNSWLDVDDVVLSEQSLQDIVKWVQQDHPTATHYIDLCVFQFTSEVQLYINSYGG